MSVAIAMSGGGAKGAFEVGVLKYLYEVKGVRPDIVSGASVGALNALKLTEGPRGSAAAFEGLERIWRSIRGEEDIFLFNPALADGLVGLGFDVIGTAVRKVGPVWIRALVDPFRRFEDVVGPALSNLDDTVRELLEEHLGDVDSVLILDPLRRLITGNLNPALVRQSGIELRIAMVDLVTGSLLFADQDGRLQHATTWQPTRQLIATAVQALRSKSTPQLEAQITAALGTPLAGLSSAAQRLERLIVERADLAPISLIDAVIASSAIPLIFDPVRVDGQILVDGGVREVIPLQAALDAGGTEVYAIAASSRELPTGLPAAGPLGRLALAATLERAISIMSSEATENDLQATRPETTIEILAPPLDVQDTLDFGPHIIALNLFYGFEVARAHFEGGQPPTNDVMLLLISLASIRDELVRVRARLQQLQNPGEPAFKSTEKATLQQRANALQASAAALQTSLERDVPRVPGLNAPVTPTIPLSVFFSPSTLTLLTNTRDSVTVGVAGQLGLGQRVNLQLSSPHPRITGTFSPEPTVTHSTLTLDVAADVTPGVYNLGVRATAGSLTATNTLKLTVKRFALSVSEPAVVLFPGAPAQQLQVGIARAPGFAGTVDLALDLVPSGAGIGASFTPDPAPGSTATLQIRGSRFAPPASLSLAIRGTSAGIIETVPFAVDVLDIGLTDPELASSLEETPAEKRPHRGQP